jgi:hypothetical protein
VTAVTSAVAAVTRAEQKLDEATVALDEAADALDVVLAQEGWTRLMGGFDPGVRMYHSPLYPGATLERTELLAQLERMAAAR